MGQKPHPTRGAAPTAGAGGLASRRAKSHYGGMRKLRRTRSWIACLAVLALAGSGCNDTPTGNAFPDLEIFLVEPLDFDWPGKETGATFLSQRGTFSAVANTRVAWSLRMEAIPADPNDPRFRWAEGKGPPLLKKTAEFQERIWFSWRRDEVFGGTWPFAVGDTCVATLHYGTYSDNQQVTVLRFVIGGGILEDEEEPSP